MHACYEKEIIPVIRAHYICSKMKSTIVGLFLKVLNLVSRALFITWKYSRACWDFIRTLANPPSFLNSHRGGSSISGTSCFVTLCSVTFAI